MGLVLSKPKPLFGRQQSLLRVFYYGGNDTTRRSREEVSSHDDEKLNKKGDPMIKALSDRRTNTLCFEIKNGQKFAPGSPPRTFGRFPTFLLLTPAANQTNVAAFTPSVPVPLADKKQAPVA